MGDTAATETDPGSVPMEGGKRSSWLSHVKKTMRANKGKSLKQVLKMGLLKSQGLNAEQEADVMSFLDKNQDRLRELSLRMAIKVGALRKTGKANWATMAKVTCCKN